MKYRAQLMLPNLERPVQYFANDLDKIQLFAKQALAARTAMGVLASVRIFRTEEVEIQLMNNERDVADRVNK